MWASAARLVAIELFWVLSFFTIAGADFCDDIFIGTSSADLDVATYGQIASEFSPATKNTRQFMDQDIVPSKQFYIQTSMARPFY